MVTEDLLCPSILVSGAGTSDGFYKIAADQHTAWAPGRQVYEHIDGDRYYGVTPVFALYLKLPYMI